MSAGDVVATAQSIDEGIREVLERLFRDLHDTGRSYQTRASALLREGRKDWEPWFEAGVELTQSAKRLRELIAVIESLERPVAWTPHPAATSAPAAARVGRDHRTPPPGGEGHPPTYPYSRR